MLGVRKGTVAANGTSLFASFGKNKSPQLLK
jgi:hypothetical protein